MNRQLIQDIEGKIEYLKDLKKELESDKKDYFIDFYETEYIEEPLEYVYIPLIKKQTLSEDTRVCPECSGKGFIQYKIDKDIHYKTCSCKKASYRYEPEKVSVTAIVADKYYIILHNKEVFRIAYDRVKACFNEDDTTENTKTLFYINKEDCETLCERLNEEAFSNDKQ